jgi:Fe-S-cluster containining protein
MVSITKMNQSSRYKKELNEAINKIKFFEFQNLLDKHKDDLFKDLSSTERDSLLNEVTLFFKSSMLSIIEKTLSENVPLKSFFDIYYQDYYRCVDILLAVFNKLAPSPITCNAKCGVCCNTLVTLAPIEAVNLWYNILKNYSDEEIRLIKKSIEKRYQLQIDITTGKDNNSSDCNALVRTYERNKIPCQFLNDEDNCSIYFFRPSICRNYNVTSDPKYCFDFIDNPEKTIVWKHPLFLELDEFFKKFLSKHYLNNDIYRSMQIQLIKYKNYGERNL